MFPEYDITVFIRTRNEAKLIRSCLERVRSQKGGRSVEILLLDSNSEDGTAEIALECGARVVQVPAKFFTYSRALNFGISQARGRYIVFLSGHAVPIDTEWLDHLCRPLDTDPRVVGVCSRQIPWSDASRTEVRGMAATFPESDFIIGKDDIVGVPPEKIFDRVLFSNASSCVRREFASDNLFPEIPFAEDRVWALKALYVGKKIAYASRSVVNHSHVPAFKDFFQVAYKATVARKLIEAEYRRLIKDTTSSRGVSHLRTLMRSIGALPYCIARAAIAAPFSKREAAFFLSSIGTSLGKYRGEFHPGYQELHELPVADPTELIAHAREL